MKISYGITVHNEADELKKLLNILIDNIALGIDEIVVCVDGNDEAVKFELDTFTQNNFDILISKCIRESLMVTLQHTKIQL